MCDIQSILILTETVELLVTYSLILAALSCQSLIIDEYENNNIIAIEENPLVVVSANKVIESLAKIDVLKDKLLTLK